MMPTPDPTSSGPLLSDPALFLGLGLLAVMSEIAVEAGIDTDGNATLQRLTKSLRMHDRLARAFRYRPGPEVEQADEDMSALIAQLERMAPALRVLATPSAKGA